MSVATASTTRQNFSVYFLQPWRLDWKHNEKVVELMRGCRWVLTNLEKNEFRAEGVASSSWILRGGRGRAGSSKENRGRQLSPQRVTGSPEDMVQPSLRRNSEIAKDGGLLGCLLPCLHTAPNLTLSSKGRHFGCLEDS